MFTGIIEEVGAVSRVSGADLAIMAEGVLEGMAQGDSIAIDGACMTVVEYSEDTFVVQVSPESMSRTTRGSLRPGDAVNLERAMAAGDRFGGHFVQGHIDGVGRVEVHGLASFGHAAAASGKAILQVSRIEEIDVAVEVGIADVDARMHDGADLRDIDVLVTHAALYDGNLKVAGRARVTLKPSCASCAPASRR